MTPEWFTTDDQGRHTKDLIFLGLLLNSLEIFRSLFMKIRLPLLSKVYQRELAVRGFVQHRCDLFEIFQIELPLKESLEDTLSKLWKEFLLIGVETGEERQSRIEETFRSPNNHSTFVGKSSTIQIEIANFIPVQSSAFFELATEGFLRPECPWHESNAHGIVLLQVQHGFQCQVGVRRFEILVELDDLSCRCRGRRANESLREHSSKQRERERQEISCSFRRSPQCIALIHVLSSPRD